MLKTSLQQRLQQRLSPQQIQYIKLLQLPTLAFEQRVAAELEQNPALEEGPEEEQELLLTEEEAQAFEVAETFVPEPEEPESETSLEVSVAPVSSPEPSIPAALGDPQTPAADGSRSEDEYSWEELLAGQDLDPERYYQTRGGEDPDEEDDPWARTPARETFIERLQAQLLYLDLDERGRLIAEQIIGSLDPDGYLRRPLSSIVDDLLFSHGVEVSEAEVETVLKQIQRLDPVGVGARSLKECLEVQLEALPESTPARELALRIVREAFGELSRKHFDAILRKFEIPERRCYRPGSCCNALTPSLETETERQSSTTSPRTSRSTSRKANLWSPSIGATCRSCASRANIARCGRSCSSLDAVRTRISRRPASTSKRKSKMRAGSSTPSASGITPCSRSCGRSWSCRRTFSGMARAI